MSELERRLSELGGHVEFPPTPDMAAAVGARIAEAPRRRSLPRPRPALVIAFVLLLCGGALAASPLRDDILDWLGIGGVEVRTVEELPPAPSASLDLGERVTLEEARERVDRDVPLPDLGEPDEVFVRTDPPGGQVAFVYRPRAGLPEARETGVGLLLTQFRATDTQTFVEKALGPGTQIERTSVNGDPAVFITGRPHAFVYVDRNNQVREERIRLASNTLLWERDGVTYRLEADLPLERTLQIAEGLHD